MGSKKSKKQPGDDLPIGMPTEEQFAPDDIEEKSDDRGVINMANLYPSPPSSYDPKYALEALEGLLKSKDEGIVMQSAQTLISYAKGY